MDRVAVVMDFFMMEGFDLFVATEAQRTQKMGKGTFVSFAAKPLKCL